MAWNRGNYGSGRGGGGGNYNRGGGRGQQQSYPNSGGLWPNDDKRSEKSPDMKGNIVMSEDVLDYILHHATEGEVKLEVSGWDREAQSGVAFLSLKVQTPYSERQERRGSPGRSRYQPRPQGDRDERAQYGPPQRNDYAQQSRGDTRGGREFDPRYGPSQGPGSQEDFARGDRMPDFMRDDQGDIPFP